MMWYTSQVYELTVATAANSKKRRRNERASGCTEGSMGNSV